MKKLKIGIMVLVGLLVVFIGLGLYNGLKVQHYDIDAQGIDMPVKIAVIADLHSCSYGKNQEKLVLPLIRQAPDIVVMVGDIFDDVRADDNTETFIKQISKLYPCYYVTGNHEFWSSDDAFKEKMSILDKYSVKRLSNEVETVTIKGQKINLAGVDDPSLYWKASTHYYDNTTTFKDEVEKVKRLSDNGNYTILMSHRPESIGLYAKCGFDLVLSGHAHGGQWRIPGILNGVYAPDQGLFPRYAGGKYVVDGTTMIVSRGLANQGSLVPRFYNRPELVILDIH